MKFVINFSYKQMDFLFITQLLFEFVKSGTENLINNA